MKRMSRIRPQMNLLSNLASAESLSWGTMCLKCKQKKGEAPQAKLTRSLARSLATYNQSYKYLLLLRTYSIYGSGFWVSLTQHNVRRD